jgi:putative peptidoglycan lipid II flippase
MTFLSRMLGFVREALIASMLGAGWVSDCFFIAFKLPNLARRLFAEGALSSLLVPQIKQRLNFAPARHNARAAKLWLYALFWQSALVLFAVLALGLLCVPLLVFALTGGFYQAEPGQQALTIALTRLTLPFVALTCLSGLLASLLNSLDRFALPAFTPVLLNVFMIAALLLVPKNAEHSVIALALSVSLAGLVQFLWLWFACKQLGWHFGQPINWFWHFGQQALWRWPKIDPRFRAFALGVLITALGQGALQFVVLINTLVAARLLPAGSVSYLFFADRLTQLPIGVIGVALSTALLPSLSAALSNHALQESQRLQNQALQLGLLLALPASLCLMVLAKPIVALSYQRGAFGAADVANTVSLLQILAALIPLAVVLKILLTCFYAHANIKTPMRVTLATLGVHSVLVWFGTSYWGLRGLGLASLLALALCLVGLGVLLGRRGWFKLAPGWFYPLLRIVCASLGVATYCYFASNLAVFDAAPQSLPFVLALVGLILSALMLYAALCAGLGLKLLALVRENKADL